MAEIQSFWNFMFLLVLQLLFLCLLPPALPLFGVIGKVHVWAKAGYTPGWVASPSHVSICRFSTPSLCQSLSFCVR